jgi:spiro-SPASM protein
VEDSQVHGVPLCNPDELPAAGPNLFVEITSRCNLACSFCPHTHLSRPKADMAKRTYDILVNRIEEHLRTREGGFEVTFSLYGEPLMHPEFVDFIRALDPTGARVFVETNGMFLNESAARSLMETECVKAVIIGVDAVTADTYARVRPGGDFKLVRENIDRLLLLRSDQNDRELIVGLSFLRLRENDGELLDFYQYWQKRADHVLVLGYNDFSGNLPDRKAADFTPLRRSPCRRIRSSLTVLQDGGYVICPQDFDGKTSSITVADTSFDEAFQQEGVRTILTGQRSGDYSTSAMCRQCDKWYLPL